MEDFPLILELKAFSGKKVYHGGLHAVYCDGKIHWSGWALPGGEFEHYNGGMKCNCEFYKNHKMETHG